MKKTLQRVSILLLTAAFVVTAFSGCGTKNQQASSTSQSQSTVTTAPASTAPTAPDISKEVKLNMYLLGDSAPDVPLVYDEINKKLKQDINATVNVNFFAWADWQKKYQLLLASGEDYDLIISAWWSQYADNARKGAFLELTDDLMKRYAPETLKSAHEGVLQAGKIDGKLYILPMNFNEFNSYGFVVRGDLMKKYNVPDIKTVDDFGVYLDALAKNEKAMIPYDTGNGYDNWGLSYLSLRVANEWYSVDNQVASIKIRDANPKVFVENDTPEALAFYKKMQDWKNKGYWSRNALVNKVTSKDSLLNGKSGACITNVNEAKSIYQSAKDAHPEWDVKFYPGYPDKGTFANSYISNGMSINAKSKNPERSLMFLDLLKNNQDYFNLTTYGIKGTHYDLDANGQMITLPGSKGYPVDQACPWGWRDDRYYKSFAGGMANYNDIIKSCVDRMVKLPAVNFFADQTNVKDKLAIFQNIGSQYELALRMGFSKDVDKDRTELMQKLKTAGIDDYLKDYQTQLDTFYAQYNK